MTVLFFILYCACIWSILGTVPCRASLVLFKHLRDMSVGLRGRGIRGSDREQAAHVQDSRIRGASVRNGEAIDIMCVRAGTS